MDDGVVFSNTTNNQPNASSQQTIMSQGGAKEQEGVSVNLSELGISDQSKEIELPKEIQDAGVKVTQQQPIVPKVISTMPVAAPAIPPAYQQNEETLNLPLSDDKIEQGLTQGVYTSWKWLSEWCARKLKQAHYVLKKVHGKIVRIRE